MVRRAARLLLLLRTINCHERLLLLLLLLPVPLPVPLLVASARWAGHVTWLHLHSVCLGPGADPTKYLLWYFRTLRRGSKAKVKPWPVAGAAAFSVCTVVLQREWAERLPPRHTGEQAWRPASR